MEKVTALDGAKIADGVYRFDREIGKYTLVGDPYNNPNIGLQLALYQNSATGDYVIAVRGTEPTAYGDWDTNVRMFVSTLADMLPSAFLDALQFIEPLMETYGLNSSNTSIVGHSMGGSIAQYLGSVKGFETLTYNAYGVGDMNMVPEGSTVNITNYITMHDFISPLPGSQMVGTTYMLQDETLTGAFGHGISNFTSVESWVRGYSLVNDPLSIDVIDGIGSSGLDSIYEAALRLSEGREFAMINGSMDDIIFGGDINNTLISGGGKDTLIGGKGFDTLKGGADFDTYIVGNGDILEDDDANKGKVIFKDIDLTGKKYKNSESGRYEDDDFVYEESGETLTVTAKSGSESITIKNWDVQKQEALGIELLDNKDIEVSITESASASEGDSGKRSLSFTVTLSRALEDGESLDVSVSGTDEGSYTFQSGERSKSFTHSWSGDTEDEGAIDHIATLTPSANYSGPSDDVKVTIKNSGTATVYDDDEDNRHDPLALDTNKDGFISTTDLEVSGTYFDITGDGLRERVGWIKSEDALVTYDKNDNGQIDGISEVFGNMNESGFEELKRLVDSNHDNIIDRRDELFQQLQVWNDFNQDAKAQEGELQSLKDAGVSSIDLNYVSTNIEINGNLLTEASKYTDHEGNKELAADIQLATDAKDTKLDLEDLPQDFTIDPATELLPQLKGTGLVYDSIIAYNLDPEFKALATEMSTNMPRVATEFSTFLEQYSGYTAYVNELQEKYSIENFEMQEVDKQAWIVERFEATDKYTTTINNYYNKSLNNSKIPTTPITNSDTIAIKYQSLANKLESDFALQSVFKDVTVDNAAEYFNDNNKTIDEKLYLAKVMYMQRDELAFSIDNIVNNIDNNITKELVRYIYVGNDATIFENSDTYSSDGLIVTSSEDEIIITSDANNKILLNGGDDKLISGKGNDTFYFRKGDGTDTIFDKGGVDILVFDEGITRESVELKLNRNSDLIIALKEDGKTFDELSDKVIMVDWMKSSNRVELIKFGDGTTLKFQDVFELFEATDGVEVIQLSSGNDIIDTKDGNDVIVALGGNDTLIGGKGDDRLDGGLGNDTYIYNRGDGKDTVIDSGGHDTLQFREGISQDDLVVQYKGNDLLVALKEEGKTFEQLSDVITLKNYKNVENTIEAIYLDGYRRVDVDALLNAPTEFDDILELSNSDQNIDLLAGDDSVVTLGGNDVVYGGSGNDVIKTNSGNDTLAGGTGDDVLEGGLGDDTYIFNRGDGKDTIYDDHSYGHDDTQKDNAGNDTLRLGEGITTDNIITKYFGTDLMIGIKEGDKAFEELSDVITIKNYGDEKNKIENILLGDGSEVEVKAPASANGYDNVATTGNDVLFFEENISIDTLQGHDFIHTGDENDDVFGNRGNDDIHTGDGDDILNGGIGIDYLLGGDGNDTYIFNRGDGNNTIFDDNRDGYVADTNMYHGMYETYPKITGSSTPQKDAGVDTLIFGEGITLDDIEVRISTESLSSSQRDIVIYIKENENAVGEREWNGNIAGDTVTIRDYFDSRNKIENILLSDGTRINIDSMINQVTNGDNQIIYLSSNEDMTIDAQDGNDIVKTALGNDTLIGGKGDDQLQGGGGDDTYIFNLGDGKDTIYDYDEARGGYFSKDSMHNGGNDTLKFGNGIKQEDLNFVFQGNDLVIKIVNTEDSITVKNYDNVNNAIENIVFDDGTKVDLKEMALKSLGENVVVPVQESQENVYTLNYDEGVKTILNSNVNDTLQIAEGIEVEQLIAQFVGNDLVIALKESGVSFDGLKDKVVIKNYLFDKIENIILNNGSKIKLNDMLLQASEDDDTLSSYEQEAIVIDGLVGNDTITTGNGNDTLIGGKGNDLLNGGAGDDTYIFNRGDGNDIISNSYGNDTLKFAEGIEAQDLEARFFGLDLVIGVKENGVAFEDWSDKVTIKSNFINNIILNDGTKLVVDYLLSQPTQGDDVLDYTYTENQVVVNGLGGNDTITTSSGNDTIIGGKGDDTLNGGAGNDTYIFNLGDGKDSIVDSGGNDSITFGEGIVQGEVLFKQDGYNLTIGLKEDGKTYDKLSDKIVIADWFKLKNNIETLKFADGSSMSATTVATMLLENVADTLFSNQGAEMRGGKGDDTYVYKKDDFTVIIDDKFANKEIAVNAGNDTLRFEDITQDQITIGTKGDDLIIKIDAGHDTYTELKDYVVIRDWQDANKGIESIVFGDGEVLAIDKTLTYPELEFDENWITGRYYIYGSEDNDIKGTEHSEVIESGAGDDTVMAIGGNDYIVGGKGDDILNGGSGNDTYVFNIGDGNDTIIDDSGLDSIKFGANITRADISITQIDNDLVMRLSADDSLTLKDWFNEETIEHRIELMVLEDEGEIAIADFIITPTEGNDNLEYGDEKNRINALGGDDIIHIGGGYDVLFGGEGNDQLYGEEGNDTLSGDKGDDVLYGGEGDDTYVYARGDGKDTIVEDGFTNWGQTGNDTLKFAEGISADDLILRQVSDNLVVALKEDGKAFEELSNTITLKKWALYDDENSRDYSRAYYAVENFTFSDGTSWSTSDIIANIGSDESETIIGFNQADTLEGKKGDDTLLGHLGDDTYIFNRGDGHDTIYDYGRKGDDYSYYDAGNDTLKFGEGISEDELMIVKEDNDVIVYIKDGNKSLDELHDKIILKDWFLTNNRIENMVLFDGSAIDYIKHLTLEPTMEDDKLIYGSDDNYVDALSGDDIVISLGGNNFIDGNSGNDSIQTAEGNDTLLGGEGDDTLDGGAGEDRLEGGSGNDTYIFGRGDGHNTIYDESGVDNLKFDVSITQDDLVLFQDGRDLIVAIKENGVDIANATDKIIIVNWLDAETRLETITFTDDTVWDVATIVSKTGTEKDDTISGTELDDAIYAKSGNDTLIGGTGNDHLEGGEGNDTYIFNRGDGKDSIYDVSGVDSLKLGEDITTDDILVRQEGDDLVIALKEEGVSFDELADKVTVANWFSAENRVETIVLADGEVLNASKMIELMPSDEDDTIVVPDELAVNIHLKDGNDSIVAGSQNDTLYGGKGNDYLEGGAGDDTYIFGRGDGHDTIYDVNGLDSIVFKDGIGVNDLFIKEEGGIYHIALDEDGKDFDTFSDVLTISKDEIEKIVFADGSGLNIADIRLHHSVEDEILEKDELTSIYEGTLSEDTSSAPHGFSIVAGSVVVDSMKVTDLNILLIDEATGTYKVDGNFNALSEGEEAVVTFKYEAHYDSDDLSLVSGVKEMSLTITGTNSSSIVVPKDLQVNTYIEGDQYGQVITALSDGGYVIAWYSYGQDGSCYGSYMQQYNSSGEKVGEEKQVNTYIEGDQSSPVITALSDGGYVIAWNSNEQDGSGYGIYMQQYNGNGEKVGEEKQVNTYIEGGQYAPVITALSDGGYVIAWNSYEQDGSVSGIYMQQYNGNGENVGEEKQVNTYIEGGQYVPVITALSDGGYVIAWYSYEQDGSGSGIYMQQYNGNGENVGEEKQVNSYTQGRQYAPVITALSDGGYVIAWYSYGQDGSCYGSYMQQYNSSGEKVGEEKQVNTYIEGDQSSPVITALSDGGYVIAWNSNEQDGSGYGIYMQQYNGNGEKVGEEKQVNTYIEGGQYAPVITALSDGGYVIAWNSYEQDGSVSGIYMQQYNGNGENVGEEKQVNTYIEGGQYGLVITALRDGGYVIAWDSYGQDGSGFGIYMQKYNSNGEEQYTGYSDDDQIIYGTSGDDILYGGEGNDVFYADDGNDTLYGGLGNDTYVFNRGDGQDTIIDEGSYSFYGDAGEGGHDKILFGEGISIDDIEVIKTNGDDLQIIIGNHQTEVASAVAMSTYAVAAQDSILIKRWYTEYAIETMQFADGSQYNIAEYFNVPLSIYANPIVLDLNHNGMTSTALETSNSYFDYDGDGNRERTAWMEVGDAQLVVDINQDGIINDGSEIFGEYTKLPDGTLAQNGYEALAQYDSNYDGVIDNRDEAFGNLLLWKDSNQNGKSEDGELTNIQTSGIIALHLNQENGITFEQSFENGNIILNETNYISGNGAGIMRDVGFAYNPFDTITDNDTLTKEYYGNLLSGGDGDDTYIFNLGDGKIIIDDNGNGEDTLSFGNGIIKEQLLVKWDKTSGALIIGVKENSADTSSLADLYNQIYIKNFFQESGSIEFFKFADGSSIDKSELYDILLDTKDAQNLTAITLIKDGQLIGGSFNDLLYGQDGEEDIQGDAGDDFLNGQSGDDLLDGGEGDDTLVGGKGDDSIYGGAGDDYYIYSKGDGRDLITDFGGNDTIALGDGIVYEDLIIEQKEDGLLITFEYDKEKAIEDRDAIFISDYGYGIFDIENIELANGEIYKIKHFLNQAPILVEECVDIMLQDIREATGDVGATDEDGDVLTYSVTTAALHGTVNVDETGTWIYSVEGTYMGTDSAVITVDDGQGGSVTKTLNFDTKVSAPSIDTVAFNLLEDNISTNNLNVYNPVGGALTYEIIATSENGMFTLDENGEYSYNPSQDYNGLDAVIVKVTNEYGLSTISTLTFDIEAVNDAPVTTETEAFILQDVREQAGEVEATDADGDILTFSVITAAQHGTLSMDETGAWTYSVDGYYMGEDSAVITVDDGNGGTATKTLTFDARVTTPSLADATANLLEDNPSNGIFNVTNPIGGVLTYEVLTSTANGDFSVNADGNWNYNPSQDYNGSDAVIVKVTNEYGLSTTSILSFEIEAVNDAPIVALESEAFTLINIRDIDGKIEANDVDGDTLTYTVDTQAANGVVTIDSEGNWHYKADGSFNGTDSATILINDGAGGTVTSRLDFTVEGYIYEGGDLVITDNGDDTLVMDNLDKSDLAFTRNGDNLNIAVKDQGSVTLTDYFINIQSGVQKITTAQGDISLDKEVIKNADVFMWRGSANGDSNVKNLLIGSSYNNSLDGNNLDDILFGGSNYDSLRGFGGNDTLIGGDNSDNLYGGDGDDNLWGDAGNDSLYGENGNDSLVGGIGHDYLYGGDGKDNLWGDSGDDFLEAGMGDDFLSSGTGSDRLEGSGGNDTYFFEKGDQSATINDYKGIGRFHSEDAGYDTIKFGDGISKDDVSFVMSSGDLYIQYGDTDTIKVNNQDDVYNKVEKLEFADGSFLTNDDIDIVIQQLNAYASDKGMWTYGNETIRNNVEMMNIVSSAWRG